MGKKEKLIKRLKSIPKDFTFSEMNTALKTLGFEKDNKGKTSGSRVGFEKDDVIIQLHKPHPGNVLLEYQVKQVLKILEREDII